MSSQQGRGALDRQELWEEYERWQGVVPSSIAFDALWKLTVYRKALFLSDMAWNDCTRLYKNKRTVSLADQLYRAIGSISANISEGYSRCTGRDRARFFEYALGSAREGRGWYFKGRHTLGYELAQHRSEQLAEVISMLLAIIPRQRTNGIREEPAIYKTEGDSEEKVERIA